MRSKRKNHILRKRIGLYRVYYSPYMSSNEYEKKMNLSNLEALEPSRQLDSRAGRWIWLTYCCYLDPRTQFQHSLRFQWPRDSMKWDKAFKIQIDRSIQNSGNMSNGDTGSWPSPCPNAISQHRCGVEQEHEAWSRREMWLSWQPFFCAYWVCIPKEASTGGLARRSYPGPILDHESSYPLCRWLFNSICARLTL